MCVVCHNNDVCFLDLKMEFDESTPLIKFGKVSPQIELVGSEPLNKDDGKVDIVDKELLDRSRWKILFAGFITMVLCLLTVRF